MTSSQEQTVILQRLTRLVGDDEELDFLVDLENTAQDCGSYAQLALGEAHSVAGEEQSSWRSVGTQAHYVARRSREQHLTAFFAVSRLYRTAIHERWEATNGTSADSTRRLIELRRKLTARHRRNARQLMAVTLSTFSRRSALEDLDPIDPDEMIFVDIPRCRESAMFQDLVHAATFAAHYGEALLATADEVDPTLCAGGAADQRCEGEAIVTRANGFRCQALPTALTELFIYKLWLSVVWAGPPYRIDRFDLGWRNDFWPGYVEAGIAEAATHLDELRQGLERLYELSQKASD